MLPTRSPQPALFKNARKKLKCNQARLARLLGVHRSTISRIEKREQCPNAELIASIERLTGKTAEVIVAEAYCCKQAQQQMAATALALPTDQYDYLHLKLHHEDALKKLKSRLRHKKRELATVKRCLAIDRSTVSALAGQIHNWQTIVELLTKAPEVQQTAIQSLQQFVEGHQKKGRMALLWAQRFTFEMEDEIHLLQCAIASRVKLLKAAEDKVEELRALQHALDLAKQQRATGPTPSPRALREEIPHHTKAPPNPKVPVSPKAPRLENGDQSLPNTASGRKPGKRNREI